MQTQAWWIIVATLVVALGVDAHAHRGGRRSSVKSSAIWTGVWVAVAVLFGGVVWTLRGAAAVQDYFAAYLIEESLSIDNLFVFLMIFRALRIPEEHQHGVLFFGVVGALGIRAAFIVAGAAALERWDWVNFVFGGLLLIAAVRAAISDTTPGESRLLRWLSRHLPVTQQPAGGRYFVLRAGRRVATPLLLALIGLELSDIIFAIDSIPAALSVSNDRFVVYASNALAICGLRSLFLVLRSVLHNLPHLHYGIAAVLLFTGIRMVCQRWWVMPSSWSIVLTSSCIGLSVLASLRARQPRGAESPP